MCWTASYLQEAVAELDSWSLNHLLYLPAIKNQVTQNGEKIKWGCSEPVHLAKAPGMNSRQTTFQAHSAQKVMQMQLAISHEPTVKVPWGPSVQGAGAQSPGRHAGWRYPYTHKDWGAQATPQPPPFPRGELLEMEKQECIECPESQETGRDEDTTALSARGGGQAGPQTASKGKAAHLQSWMKEVG